MRATCTVAVVSNTGLPVQLTPSNQRYICEAVRTLFEQVAVLPRISAGHYEVTMAIRLEPDAV
jgi:hypothetical protein